MKMSADRLGAQWPAPAQQGLGAHPGAAAQVHDGLVGQIEIPVLDGALQLRAQIQRAPRLPEDHREHQQPGQRARDAYDPSGQRHVVQIGMLGQGRHGEERELRRRRQRDDGAGALLGHGHAIFQAFHPGGVDVAAAQELRRRARIRQPQRHVRGQQLRRAQEVAAIQENGIAAVGQRAVVQIGRGRQHHVAPDLDAAHGHEIGLADIHLVHAVAQRRTGHTRSVQHRDGAQQRRLQHQLAHLGAGEGRARRTVAHVAERPADLPQLGQHVVGALEHGLGHGLGLILGPFKRKIVQQRDPHECGNHCSDQHCANQNKCRRELAHSNRPHLTPC